MSRLVCIVPRPPVSIQSRENDIRPNSSPVGAHRVFVDVCAILFHFGEKITGFAFN
eukprot:m.126598 g.126598  ORF g.126598 m.126598 type:complete len:56 (+) comp13574_c0_seq5:461-628(+)